MGEHTMHECNRALHNYFDRYCNSKHALLYSAAVLLLVHLLIVPFCIEYDVNYWTYVTRNLRAGFGLYELDGYYYTPVWGDVISLVNLVETYLVPDLGLLSERVYEALVVECVDSRYYTTATIASLSFAYLVKFPLILSDLLAAYLLYVLVKEHSNDTKKAIFAFFLCGLCPIIVGATAMTAMPDTISVSMLLLTLILITRNHYFLAGASYSVAVLTKFFPIFVLPVLIVYVLSRKTGKEGLKKLFASVLGATVLTVLIFLPTFLEGTFLNSFAFISDRISTGEAPSLWDEIISKSRVVVYLGVIVVSLFLSLRLWRIKAKDIDNAVLNTMFLVLLICMLYPPAPQYVVVLIPFLVYVSLISSAEYLRPWMIISISAFLFVPATQGLTLMTLAEWTSLIEIDTAMGIFSWYQNTLFGLTYMDIQYFSGGILQYAGILLALLIVFKRHLSGTDLCDSV